MTGIIIITYNTPIQLLLLQLEAIAKFCQDVHQVIVFDNSNLPESQEQIAHQIRIRPEIKYYKCQSSSQNGSDSHAFAANLSYTMMKDKYDVLFYMDHDLIPLKSFSVQSTLDGRLMAGIGHGDKKTYFWPGCFMFNNAAIQKDMLSFSPSHELGLDTGGGLQTLIEYHGIDKCRFFNEEYRENPNFTKSIYTAYALINDGMFMHFINGSGWNPSEANEERVNSLISIAKQLIS